MEVRESLREVGRSDIEMLFWRMQTARAEVTIECRCGGKLNINGDEQQRFGLCLGK